MRHQPIDPALFIENRQRLNTLLAPNSLAVLNANDILPTNADGVLPLQANADLFYLSGIEQEESILLIAPDAYDEKPREVLFLRETSEHIATWEGHKLTKENATKVSGIKNVKWLAEFPSIFHRLMCESQHVYLNSNEHNRARIEVQTRDARFIADCKAKYPLHDYQRLAQLMHRLRVVKSNFELDLLRKAMDITQKGFERAARFVKPGVKEYEIEAEFAHEFTRHAARFAYGPIIASGKNNNILHYSDNDQVCQKGDLLLMDVAASYANYNADLTRTIPVSGRFSKRQKQVYNAVLRVLRASIKGATIGKTHRQWTRESQAMMNEELLSLGLLKSKDVKKQAPEEPACRKYFMHGLGHPLGLDVHDVGLMSQPFAAGWVLTVEPGIYIPEEGFGIRLENDVVVTEKGAIDLMADVPLEANEIEDLMNR
ncbi:MAG TPA: Xaa-Pro aminopeptidase [Tepidisphaeraceae bacterium]|nr:Xaa-Pro aminopeptidase [Tepidisphaeraceae bacterium]